MPTKVRVRRVDGMACWKAGTSAVLKKRRPRGKGVCATHGSNRFRFVDVVCENTAIDGGQARPYRFGYGHVDTNLDFRVDEGGKKVYFEFSDYSTSYVFMRTI